MLDSTSIEINVNQSTKDNGIQIDKNGKDVLGIVNATISHKEHGITTWGFRLLLNFMGELQNNEDGSPNLAFNLLDVSHAHTWYENIESANSDYVKYTLSEKEREIIIPMLRTAVMSHIANSDIDTILTNPPKPKHDDVKTVNNAISEATSSDSYNHTPEHMSLDFSSQGYSSIDVLDEAFNGSARGLIDERIEFTVDFDGYFKENYQQAEYLGGVLITPKKISISDFSIPDFDCDDFFDIENGKRLSDYKLSENDEKIIKYIIIHEIKKLHTQREFPLGESNQLGIAA